MNRTAIFPKSKTVLKPKVDTVMVMTYSDDGNFGVAFLSGAAASGIGSLPCSFDRQRLVKLLAGYASGGLVSWAAGESFVQGVLRGLNIGLLNHYIHDTRESTDLTRDADGNLHGELAEFVYEGKKTSSFFDVSIFILSYITTTLDYLGESLENYAENSTLTNKGKFHWSGKNKRRFYGNQHVQAIFLSEAGKKIANKTTIVGLCFNGYDLYDAYMEDLRDEETYGRTNYYRSAKVLEKAIGSALFGRAGMYAGYLCSVGGPLAGVAGGFLIGMGASFLGEYIGDLIVDNYYRSNNLFIP